jgi:hypothetical protein
MKQTTKWIVGIAATIGIAGCGATTSPATTVPTAAATATPAATPTPTPNLTPTAAAAYLAAATTGNSATHIINKTCTTITSRAQGARCWSRYEAVERAFLTTIFAIQYPVFMKIDVDAQIAAETKVINDYVALAANPYDSVAYASAHTDSGAMTGAANIVRHDLGLPQVPLI